MKIITVYDLEQFLKANKLKATITVDGVMGRVYINFKRWWFSNKAKYLFRVRAVCNSIIQNRPCGVLFVFSINKLEI